MFLPLSRSRYRAIIHNNFICLCKDVSPDVKQSYEANHCNKLPRQQSRRQTKVSDLMYLHLICFLFPTHHNVSRSPHRVPKSPLNVSKSPQGVPRSSQSVPRSPQERPQITSDHPNTFPSPHILPERLQIAPDHPSPSPKVSKIIPGCPQITSRGPLNCPRSP